jgi:hypothetical protein
LSVFFAAFCSDFISPLASPFGAGVWANAVPANASAAMRAMNLFK